MKKVLLLVLFALLPAGAYADGAYFSDYTFHLYEPNQKAVVAWDGGKEIMILASAVASDGIANFAWVVPIQSLEKPEVTAGSSEIFRHLALYFKEEAPYQFKEGYPIAMKAEPGVEVVETKEIDVYDIAILKATNADALIEWLNNNNYKTTKGAKPILDKYVQVGDFYFIANRIDLKNKWADELGYLEHPAYGKFVFAKEEWADDRLYERKKADIAAKILCEDELEGQEWEGVSEEDVKPYLGKYEFGDKRFCSLLAEDQEGRFGQAFVTLMDKRTFGGCDPGDGIKLRVKCEPNAANEMECYPDEITPGATAYFMDIYSDEEYCGVIEAGSFNKEWLEVYSEENINKNRKIFNRLEADISALTDELRAVWKFELEYENLLSDLKTGMSTPLKITFMPKYPYYPLLLSRLNKGETLIEVYVLANIEIKDYAGLLWKDKAKLIDNNLKKALGGYLELGGANYVTRLKYSGPLAALNADALFAETPPSGRVALSVGEIVSADEASEEPAEAPAQKEAGFLQRIWNWLSRLFD